MRIAVVPFAVYDPFFIQVRAGVEAASNELEKNNVIIEWLNEEEAKRFESKDIAPAGLLAGKKAKPAEGVAGI